MTPAEITAEDTELLRLCDEFLEDGCIKAAVALEMNGQPAAGQALREGRQLARALKAKLTPPAPMDAEVLRDGISQLYQVIGILADEAGLFQDNQVVKALDWAANPEGEADLLPFHPTKLQAQPPAPMDVEVADIAKRHEVDERDVREVGELPGLHPVTWRAWRECHADRAALLRKLQAQPSPTGQQSYDGLIHAGGTSNQVTVSDWIKSAEPTGHQAERKGQP